jgi:hypothetical protein
VIRAVEIKYASGVIGAKSRRYQLCSRQIVLSLWSAAHQFFEYRDCSFEL